MLVLMVGVAWVGCSGDEDGAAPGQATAQVFAVRQSSGENARGHEGTPPSVGSGASDNSSAGPAPSDDIDIDDPGEASDADPTGADDRASPHSSDDPALDVAQAEEEDPLALQVARRRPNDPPTGPFRERTCRSCTTNPPEMYSEVPSFRFDVLDDLPTDPNVVDRDFYINNVAYALRLLANRRVQRIQFFVERHSFSARDDSFDALLINSLVTGEPQLTLQRGVGSANAWFGQPLSIRRPRLRQCGTEVGCFVSPAEAMLMTWFTDSAGSDTGISLTRARVCCDNSVQRGGSRIVQLRPSQRYTGLLLGRTDVVYASILPAPEGQEINIVTWTLPGGTSSVDADLYVRCGRLPTPGRHNFRSTHAGTSREHVAITLTPCSSSWYIAVHARQGGGPFNLMASYGYRDRQLELVARTDFPATREQLEQLGAALVDANERLFGLTAGQYYFRQLTLINSNACRFDDFFLPGPFEDVCILDADGKSSEWVPGHHIHWRPDRNDVWEGRVLVHELGHSKLQLPDEYHLDDGDVFIDCGHTIMGNSFREDLNQLCTAFDHRTDGYRRDPVVDLLPPPNPFPVPNVSNWDQIAGDKVPNQPFGTPDNYPFTGHGFARLSIIGML